ncbi:InaA protein [Azoarcus sp. DD4]|uniref:lipopolysaccharide kinase InaA family protein n=1 Tax=Azoarcus sp. DD4 TaxID=2027405 RepID=UPI001126C866|nr:lipopolysaccharide kinase InaA family protein [Azoarcus sp. DD4]QDF98565.1 InaA protein [Azoarcus sp. DD4]
MTSTLAPGLTPAHDKRYDFDAWWSLSGEFVETPNERRGGWSGVVRATWNGVPCYVKRQHNHLCRSAGHPFGWPTASREHFYLNRVGALGIIVPQVLYHGVRQQYGKVDAVLATRALAGFAPLSAQALDAERRIRLAAAVGHTIGILHRARLQHGCLYDKHIMVRWSADTPEVALLDLEKMRPRLTRRIAADRDLSQLRRHQQLWTASEWRQLEAAHASMMSSRR